MKRIEERGAIESAHRIRQVCGQIFRLQYQLPSLSSKSCSVHYLSNPAFSMNFCSGRCSKETKNVCLDLVWISKKICTLSVLVRL
ncbi:hypothetical protein [Coxiella-like endosymbiont]|uniref:hypothetical protein n=1 Tax=Coxiella-like endosymbiont TaxID=1592897 RepID=UPI003F6F8E29